MNMLDFNDFLNIEGRECNTFSDRQIVCIQGLGFVGSAMAVATSIAKDEDGNAYFNVIGVDLDNKQGMDRIDSINRGEFPFSTDDDLLKNSTKDSHLQQNLVATSNVEAYSIADIIIVDIHLDIDFHDDKPLLDFSNLEKGLETIAKSIQKGALIIIETTVPPGTCEKIVIPKMEKELLKRGLELNDIFIAHSYERVMPGENYLDSIINFWRVFSGMNEESADRCESFLSKVINTDEFPLTRLSSMTASETAKVLENSYRAANIAFMDEWTKYAELVGVNLIEVIDSIKKRPTHNNIMYPGLGVGGYCLTKDPSFAPAATEQLFGFHGQRFPFLDITKKVNRSMPDHAFDHTMRALEGSISGKKILICGVAYRQNVGDTRFSPSEYYARKCISNDAVVDYFDPHVIFWEEMQMESQTLPLDFSIYHLVLFAVKHNEFLNLDYEDLKINQSLTIIDTANILDKKKINSICSNLIRIGDGNKSE